MAKIYVDDPVVPYKSTTIDPLTTKAEIDGMLARWGIKLTAWNFDPEHNNVFLQFELNETINGVDTPSTVRIYCPTLWDKKTKNKPETINWKISMRIMHWFLKANLEMTHCMASDKTVAFLPYIVGLDGETQLKDLIIPKLGEGLSLGKALTHDPRKTIELPEG